MQQSQWLKYGTLGMKQMGHQGFCHDSRVTFTFLSYLLPQKQNLVGTHNHC